MARPTTTATAPVSYTHLDVYKRQTDTEVVAYAWMGAIYGLVIRWVTTGEPEPGRIMDGLVPLLLRSVGYESPPSVAPTEEQRTL